MSTNQKNNNDCKCPTCGVQTRRASHRGRYCELCWMDWMNVSLGGAK